MKCLFVTTSNIGAGKQGDHIYSTQIYKALQKTCSVEIFQFRQKNNYLAAAIFFFLPMMWVRNFSLQLAITVLKERGKYDAICIDHYRCAWILLIAKLINKKALIFNHNLESSVYKSLSKSRDASLHSRLFCYFEYTKVLLSEKIIFRLAHGLCSISCDDIPSNIKCYSQVLPPYSASPLSTEKMPEKPTAIIIGSFHWRLKQHNLIVFLDAFYELYKKKQNYCSVIVAGSAPRSFFSLIERAYPFVTIIESFDDLSELVGVATVGVCPDQAGGGFKLKTLDYFKLGLPMLAIDNGASGLIESVVPSYNSFELLAKEVYVLLDDDKQRKHLLHRQKNYFLQYHSESSFLEIIEAFIEQ
ncbi:glycosyltransferase [Aeromonas jandaei]|uniref:glycosyltransferase n=1 Tax=Aeromonas jandaei TaxID=650 RepID=UPI003BA3BAEC